MFCFETVRQPSNVICGCLGRFYGSEIQIVTTSSKALRVHTLSNTGDLICTLDQSFTDSVRAMGSIRVPGDILDSIILVTSSGAVVVLSYQSHLLKFVPQCHDIFSKSGNRRCAPGDLAVDPAGRAFMIAAIENQKIAYTVSRLTNSLSLSSPLISNRMGKVSECLIACEVGYANPRFVALESDRDTGLKHVVTYELDLGTNNLLCVAEESTEKSSYKLVYIPLLNSFLRCSATGIYFHQNGVAINIIQIFPVIGTFYTQIKEVVCLQTANGDVLQLNIIDKTLTHRIACATLSTLIFSPRRNIFVCYAQFGDHSVYLLNQDQADVVSVLRSNSPVVQMSGRNSSLLLLHGFPNSKVSKVSTSWVSQSIGSSELPDCPKAVWPIGNPLRYILITFPNSTVCLSFGEEVVEDNDVEIERNTSTIFAGSLTDKEFLQVTPNILIALPSKKLWKTVPAILAFAMSETLLGAALASNELVIIDSGMLQEVSRIKLTSTVLKLSLVDSGDSTLIIVSSADSSLRVFEHSKRSTSIIQVCATFITGSVISSVCVLVCDSSSFQILAAAENGKLYRAEFNSVSQRLSSLKLIRAFSAPVTLTEGRVHGEPVIILRSEKLMMLRLCKRLLVAENVTTDAEGMFLSPVTFNTDELNNGLIYLSGQQLVLSTMQRPFENYENTFETDRTIRFRSVCDDSRLLFCSPTTCESDSNIHVCDLESFAPKFDIPLGPEERCLSMAVCSFQQLKEGKAVLIVATVSRYLENGNLKTYLYETDGFQLVHTTQTAGIPLLITPLDDKLVVLLSVNGDENMCLFELGKSQLLLKSTLKLKGASKPNILIGMHGLIFVGQCQGSSVAIRYNQETMTFSVVGKDPLVRRFASALILDCESILVSDLFGSVAMLRVLQSCNPGLEPFLDTVSHFHYGSIITSLTSADINNDLIFGSCIDGAILKIKPVYKSRMYSFGLKLQSSIGFFEDCGRDYLKSRSNSIGSVGVVDVDYCKRFLEFDVDLQTRISTLVGSKLLDVVEYLEKISS